MYSMGDLYSSGNYGLESQDPTSRMDQSSNSCDGETTEGMGEGATLGGSNINEGEEGGGLLLSL